MAADKSSQPETDVVPASATPLPSEAETELHETSHVSDVVAASDVMLADDATGAAPSFPAPPPTPRPLVKKLPDRKPLALLPGAKVDDFEVVRLLGRGAFGHVYLARQLSLDRHVALKVSANRGSEGRTMARLEHQHIVQVFSEKVDLEFNQRLLCMQLVPGMGLEKIIAMLHPVPGDGVEQPPEWTGAELLGILDRTASLPTALDPSALHDREALMQMDAVEATAWFGGRLAEALDFAHHHGVLHRDIKPANILVNTYGRPLLADFNISSQPTELPSPGPSPAREGENRGGEEMFGGTFAYMSPEHLDAFNPSDDTKQEAVTSRSDIYSLGLVLQQMLDGRMAFPPAERKPDMATTLREMSDKRKRWTAKVEPGVPSARKTLERTIARCLEPDPEERFASGAELAEQLDGCRQLRAAEKRLPTPPKPLSPVLRKPFLWLMILVLLPQIAGSAVNITYNNTQIVTKLTPEQQDLFWGPVLIVYNSIVYPLAVALFLFAIWPVWECWKALEDGEALPDGAVTAARRRALHLPGWIAALTAGGWFPGAILFPALIHAFAPRLEPRLMAHFFVSFTLSGLIALAYSLCGAQFVILRALYPGMWRDVRGFTQTARKELEPMSARLKYIQLLAGSIPLLAAILTLGVAGETPDRGYRLMTSGLIILGVVGSHLANAVTRGLSQVVVTLTGGKA